VRQGGAVIVAVVDAAETENALFGGDGAATALSPGACLVLWPTISAASVEAVATRLDPLGVDWIEAPPCLNGSVSMPSAPSR
jgi:3-hydroxyisobutyrate dehydrogenase-like beta-hydroxyacid dehydrogenase